MSVCVWWGGRFIQMFRVNCIAWTCPSVWSTLCQSCLEPFNGCLHGFRWVWPHCQMKLVGTLWWLKEVMVLWLLDRSKRDNECWFCHIVKASVSIITRNIKTAAYATQIQFYKEAISLTAKFIIFPVFWWHESQKIYNVTGFVFYFFTKKKKVEMKKLCHREDPRCRICMPITVSFEWNFLKWKL